MIPVLVVALIAVGLSFAAYKVGARSSAMSLALAAVLLWIARYFLLVWKFRFGEGAAAGVVVIAAGAWALGGMCLVLAATMLFASYRVRGSVVALMCLLLVVAPFAAFLTYRVVNSQGAGGNAAPSAAAVQPARESSYAEGYNWALDNGVASANDCTPGSEKFIAGCKAAVLRWRSPPAK